MLTSSKVSELRYTLERHLDKLKNQLEQTADALGALRTDEDILKRSLDSNPSLTRADKARMQEAIAALPQDVHGVQNLHTASASVESPLPDSSDVEWGYSPLPDCSDNEHDIPIATSESEEDYILDKLQ